MLRSICAQSWFRGVYERCTPRERSGPRLSQWDVLTVQSMLLRASAGEGHISVAHSMQKMRSLDALREARMWDNGETCILFPHSFDWSLRMWLTNSTPSHSRRIQPNMALTPTLRTAGRVEAPTPVGRRDPCPG